MLCLMCLVNGLNTNAYTNERIKQITQEIMHPDSRYMKEISERTKEIMSPCSKYMTEIRRVYRLFSSAKYRSTNKTIKLLQHQQNQAIFSSKVQAPRSDYNCGRQVQPEG